MSAVPRWTTLSASAAPAVLAAGCLAGDALQRHRYDPVRDTISALASLGATDRWVMTTAMVTVGCCYLVTAWGLRPVGHRARLALAAGGVATFGVAAFPQPAVGMSVAHETAVGLGVAAMALWPLLVATDAGVTRTWGVASSAVLLTLLAWFLVELVADLGHLGLAERAAATAQAAWPVVYLTVARRAASYAPRSWTWDSPARSPSPRGSATGSGLRRPTP